jgi:hypothetical protein
MVYVTVHSSLQMSLRAAWDGYAANPWAVATLWDAYCGFITFFCWVCYKEASMGPRVLWFILIMALGNIAMSFYMLIQLFRLRDDQPIDALVRRQTA